MICIDNSQCTNTWDYEIILCSDHERLIFNYIGMLYSASSWCNPWSNKPSCTLLKFSNDLKNYSWLP